MEDSTSGGVIKNHAALIWSVADLLRGTYKQSEYGRVILPLVVLRRLDCVLEPTKAKVLETAKTRHSDTASGDALLRKAAGDLGFYNTSVFDFAKLLDDAPNIKANLHKYIAGYSSEARDIIDKFGFDPQIDRLAKADLLFLVVSRLADVDLHPDAVSNLEMGYLYEELIRKFSELSNETAGEHFTPREVIRLMVDLLLNEDGDVLSKPGIVRTILDPACGTGGMLSTAEEYVRTLNPQAHLRVFGQELNDESYAICRSDLLIKGDRDAEVVNGNSFSQDGFEGKTFDYLLANPPFGVEWKMVKDAVELERKEKGFAGRFGAGLPRINDGSFLFLQHMVSKMKRVEDGGSRLAIVFNGSPLFTGAAGSGESEIRRWIIENDWLEAVVALPDQLFYNTGISTYFWVVTNRKSPERRGKVQLVDARQSFTKMRKSLGEKRKEIGDSPTNDQIADIVRLYGAFEEGDRVKILPNEAFGFLRVTVERPLRIAWEATPESLVAFDANKKLQALDPPLPRTLRATLEGWIGIVDRGTDEGSIRDHINAHIPDAFTPAKRKSVTDALLDCMVVKVPDGEPIRDKKGGLVPDPDLRDNENVALPLDEPVTYEHDVTGRLASPAYEKAVAEHLATEVHPYVPDAWVDGSKTKVGYEIPLTRHFYRYVPPRPLEEIDAEIKQLESEIQELLAEVTE